MSRRARRARGRRERQRTRISIYAGALYGRVGDSLPAFVHACDRWDSYICAFGSDQIQNHCCRIPLAFDPRFFLVCGIPTFKDDFGLIAE